MKLALVGDIGGTNARFALWKDQQLASVQVLATADFACPQDAIGAYLQGLGLAPEIVDEVTRYVAHEWADELPRLETWLDSFGQKLPQEIRTELDALTKAVQA